MEKKSSRTQNLIIVLCWMVYTFAYFGRYSYNSNITPILSDYGVSNADAGLVSTFFFFTYGIGQVVNGFFCRRYNKKILFPIVLFLSAFLNFAVVILPFSSFKYLWAINGFLQSTLWSSIICLLSTTLDSEHMNRALIIMSTTSTAGTVMIYGASAFFVWLGNYRVTFVLGGIIMSAVGLLWLALYKNGTTANAEQAPQKTAKSGSGMRTIVFVLVCLAVFGVSDNLIKDGLNTWVPTILTDKYGLKSEVSILSAIVLPLLGMFGSMLSVRLNKIVTDFVSLTAILFAVSAMFIAVIVGFDGGSPLTMIVCFSIVTLLMHAVNSIITAIAPLKLRDKVDSGKMAGILNGFCYLGSTLSSYGLGAVADAKGWSAVFVLILAICIASVLIGVFYLLHSRIKTRNR